MGFSKQTDFTPVIACPSATTPALVGSASDFFDLPNAYLHAPMQQSSQIAGSLHVAFLSGTDVLRLPFPAPTPHFARPSPLSLFSHELGIPPLRFSLVLPIAISGAISGGNDRAGPP